MTGVSPEYNQMSPKSALCPLRVLVSFAAEAERSICVAAKEESIGLGHRYGDFDCRGGGCRTGLLSGIALFRNLRARGSSRSHDVLYGFLFVFAFLSTFHHLQRAPCWRNCRLHWERRLLHYFLPFLSFWRSFGLARCSFRVSEQYYTS